MIEVCYGSADGVSKRVVGEELMFSVRREQLELLRSGLTPIAIPVSAIYWVRPYVPPRRIRRTKPAQRA